MFTHVMVGTNNLEKSRQFYAATLGALGYEPHHDGDRTFFTDGTAGFGVGRPANGEAASYANGGTIGFRAKTTAEVDAFHAAGLANGGTCEGKPGVRENGCASPMGPICAIPTATRSAPMRRIRTADGRMADKVDWAEKRARFAEQPKPRT